MTAAAVLTIFVFWLATLLAWDYYRHQADGMTISRALIQLGARYPAITWLVGFGMGVLVGHLYC